MHTPKKETAWNPEERQWACKKPQRPPSNMNYEGLARQLFF